MPLIMKPIVLALIFSLLFVSIGFSQAHFLKGYIITLENDTILGHIKDESFSKKMMNCTFKPNGSNESIDYAPGGITAYGFDEYGLFVSKSYISKDSTIVRDYFYQVLFDGAVQVYMIRENGKNTFFIQKENAFYRLEKTDATLYNLERQRSQQYEKKLYVGHLNMVFADAPGLKRKIEKTSLNPNSLISLSKTYHQHVGNQLYSVPYFGRSYFLTITPIIAYSFNRSVYMFNRFDPIYISAYNPETGLMLNLEMPKIRARPFVSFSHERFSGESFNVNIHGDESFNFLEYRRIYTNAGLIFPMSSFQYPSYVHAGISVTRFLDFESSGSNTFNKTGLGLAGGIDRHLRLNNQLALSIGFKTAFLIMRDGEKARNISSAGLHLGLAYRTRVAGIN